MKKSRIAFVMLFAPAVLVAQSATATTSTTAEAAAKAGKSSVAGNAQAATTASATAEIPSHYSAEAQARLSATYQRARERRLPERPIRDRVNEGQAKGASEAQVVFAAQRAEARLETAQSAMVRAGRQPSEAELIRAEAAMARGATEAQIEAVARRAEPDRPITVALDALLSANNNGANAGVNGAVATPGVGASTSVTGAAAAATTTGAATVTGAATAGVGAVIKKPPTA